MPSRTIPSLTVVATFLLLSFIIPSVAAELKVHGSSTVAGGVLVPNKAAIEKAITQTRSTAAPLSLPVTVTVADGKVTVNVPAADRRENRLKLLNEIREATRAVADFSKIEG